MFTKHSYSYEPLLFQNYPVVFRHIAKIYFTVFALKDQEVSSGRAKLLYFRYVNALVKCDVKSLPSATRCLVHPRAGDIGEETGGGDLQDDTSTKVLRASFLLTLLDARA